MHLWVELMPELGRRETALFWRFGVVPPALYTPPIWNCQIFGRCLQWITDILIHKIDWVLLRHFPGFHNLWQASQRLARELGESEEMEREWEGKNPSFLLQSVRNCHKMLKCVTLCHKMLKYYNFCRECHKNLNIHAMRKWFWIKSACEETPQVRPAFPFPIYHHKANLCLKEVCELRGLV